MKNKQKFVFASTSVLAAGMAQGAVNHSAEINYQITGTGSYSLDLNQDSLVDYTIRFDGFNGATDTKPFVDSRTTNPNAWVLSKANGGSSVTLVGAVIDSTYAAAFPTNRVGYLYQQYQDNTVVGDWSPSAVTDGFVGLELVNGTDANYGWVHLIYDPISATKSLTVVDYAFETTAGIGIVTDIAPVPEPASFALLGMGGLALLVARRK